MRVRMCLYKNAGSKNERVECNEYYITGNPDGGEATAAGLPLFL
jgi:hypothetical protein